MEISKDDFIKNLKVFNEVLWEGKVTRVTIDKWLENFCNKQTDHHGLGEHLYALYLLNQFMYFGNKEIKELLKALYRDLCKYPIIQEIRKNNSDTKDMDLINRSFEKELKKTRFLGIGNPSESGYHLLYYFRQENSLPKELFIHTHQIFSRYSASPLALRDNDISRYIFIDDIAGSGTQAKDYSREILTDIKNLKANIKVSYYLLFATRQALKEIRDNTAFDSVQAIFELDETFKCFDINSRYFSPNGAIDKNFAENMCRKYGNNLYPGCPLGYKDGQLLLGFHHNTPDNVLPIFWYDEPGASWIPIFRRYPKIEGWVL